MIAAVTLYLIGSVALGVALGKRLQSLHDARARIAYYKHRARRP